MSMTILIRYYDLKDVLVIISDQYYKAGPASTSSTVITAYKEYPTWLNLVKDVNTLLESHPTLT